jgi:hypothetical protein
MRHADFPTAKAEVFRIIGRNDFLREGTPPGRSQRGRIVQTYDYTDEGGSLLFQTVRMDPKGFKQRRPDGHGRWLWNLNGVLPVLYRLPELLSRKNETLFIVEGEKDVHSLESMGLLATCNPMGAGKWRSEYSNAILGRSVVILSDNDPPVDENGNPHRRGQKHAGEVAKDLLRVGCEVRIIELPEAKDVSDWIALGGTRQDLQSLVSKQTALNEETLATWRSRWSPQAGEEDPRDESLNGRASREPNQAQLLITFAEQAKLFHTPEGEAFAELPVAVHFETWILRSRGFRRWLIKEVLSRNSMNTKQR